jgi:sugar/nucleoside kinase (ribokinase family)
MDLAVVGEINADLILRGNVIPAFGQVEQIVKEADLVMGSSAVIFACGAVRLGLTTAFFGKVGDDMFGNFMVESMTKRGIDTSGIIRDPKVKTGFSVILSKEQDRAILTYPGSIPELRYDEIDLQLVSRCRHLHLSSFFLLNNLRPYIPTLFRNAKAAGLTISLDTNYDPDQKWDGYLNKAMETVDVFLPNETEAKAISRKRDAKSALLELQKSIPTVAVKLGEDGAIAKQAGNPIIQQPALAVKVVDTVGAGDSFDAGFIYGYLNGWSLAETLEFAVACGSISTTKAGGTEGQANLDIAMIFIHGFNNQAGG